MTELAWVAAAILICLGAFGAYQLGVQVGYRKGRADYQEARDRNYYGTAWGGEQAQGFYKGPSRDEGGGDY